MKDGVLTKRKDVECSIDRDINKMFYNILGKNKGIKSCVVQKKVVSLQAFESE